VDVEKIVQKTKAYYCLDCGICTGSCPISRVNPRFSPRLVVEKALLGFGGEIMEDKDLWACLTCGACAQRCPASVGYDQFIWGLRGTAHGLGYRGVCTHAGVLREMMNIQTTDLVRKSTAWVGNGRRIAQSGDTYYFVGCIPFFSVVFKEIGVEPVDTGRAAIDILNALGIAPVVSPRERCCGYDMYAWGDLEGFQKLARQNMAVIRESGARRVVFTCPEGYYAFRVLYPEFVGDPGVETLHISELVMRAVEQGKLELGGREGKVTYHDPCRLGRSLGVFDAPREVLKSIKGLEVVEMARNRQDALCCGSSNWVTCTSCNKLIQYERLREAKSTGASLLVTACPKCRIHLSCAMYDGDEDVQIEIKDITTLVGECIGAGDRG